MRREQERENKKKEKKNETRIFRPKPTAYIFLLRSSYRVTYLDLTDVIAYLADV